MKENNVHVLLALLPVCSTIYIKYLNNIHVVTMEHFSATAGIFMKNSSARRVDGFPPNCKNRVSCIV